MKLFAFLRSLREAAKKKKKYFINGSAIKDPLELNRSRNFFLNKESSHFNCKAFPPSPLLIAMLLRKDFFEASVREAARPLREELLFCGFPKQRIFIKYSYFILIESSLKNSIIHMHILK